MSAPQKYTLGCIKNCDKIALRLYTTTYVDLSSFNELKQKQRVFNIYQWKNNITNSLTGEIYSGWTPWLHFGKNKWSKYDKELEPEQYRGGPLMYANKFFQSFEEFKDWVGHEYHNLLIDLF